MSTCLECQRRKAPPTKPAGLLHPVPVPETPFAQIGIDLLDPFPLSDSGNRWVIVATDYLSRYAETKAIITTDKGAAFTAELLRIVLTLSGTAHRKTTAYHPQTNELAERLNKTIADMLCMYVDVEHKNWDTILPYATLAYNTALQETTKMTPFALVHGREVTTMLDYMLPHDCNGSDADAADFTERAEEAQQLARVRITSQQERDARSYNLRHQFAAYGRLALEFEVL